MSKLDYCLEQIKLLEKDEIFLVKDLFKGFEWKRLGTERLTLGTLFLSYVKEHPELEIEILNKTSSNQQRYKKI